MAMSAKVWMYTYQLRALKNHKYRRCKKIERKLGLQQHITVKWRSGRQWCAYSVVMVLFIIVWVVVALTALCTRAAT